MQQYNLNFETLWTIHCQLTHLRCLGADDEDLLVGHTHEAHSVGRRGGAVLAVHSAHRIRACRTIRS